MGSSARRRGGRVTGRVVTAGLLALAGLSLTEVPAGAATFTVTTTADVVNPADGLVSLREAVASANGNASNDVIVLQPGAQYHLTSCAAGELHHSASQALSVTGNGATVDQTCPDTRILHSSGMGAALDIDDLVLTNSFVSSVTLTGAALFVNGPGGPDRDLLVGGPGRDVLDGDAGRDLCLPTGARGC